MHLIRFRRHDAIQVGVVRDGHISVLPVPTLASLLTVPLAQLRDVVDGCTGDDASLRDVELLPPVDGRTEVWASGVTYEISREARVEESESSADVYRKVYDADRPELFFKAPAWRVVGDGQVVGIRTDSTLDVPEPELALVVNRDGDIVGYTVSDDVSSRSIEGENPLYLPQAKTYAGACALGPAIRPVVGGRRPVRAHHHLADLARRSTRVGRRHDDRPAAPQARRARALAVCGSGLPGRCRALDRNVSRPGGRLRSAGG